LISVIGPLVPQSGREVREVFDLLAKKILARPNREALLDFVERRAQGRTPRKEGEGMDRIVRGKKLRDLTWGELPRAQAGSTVDAVLYILVGQRVLGKLS
jgi:hypothetical protein